jgi:hypothetical protein
MGYNITWEGQSRGPLIDIIYRTCMDNGNEQSNKWGDKAHLRMLAPLPSRPNAAKTKSATGAVISMRLLAVP